MDAVLLDTTVVSLLHPKKKGNPLRARYEAHMTGKVFALSFQSVAELWSWAGVRPEMAWSYGPDGFHWAGFYLAFSIYL